MARRAGVTLMEVLVAIFIMGIGMLAMLVLFPLGVLRMSLAIQHDRCAQACRQASAMANFQQLRNDPWMMGDPYPAAAATVLQAAAVSQTPAIVVTITHGGSGYSQSNPPAVVFSAPPAPPPPWIQPSLASGTAIISPAGQVIGVNVASSGNGYFTPPTLTIAPPPVAPPAGQQASAIVNFDAFANPWTPSPGMPVLLPADPNGPSYPVFVDPIGYYPAIGSGNSQFWLAGQTGYANTIARRTCQFCVAPVPAPGGNFSPTSPLARRWTCLQDELPFTTDPASSQATLQYDLEPNPPIAGSFTRNINYSWAWLLKRPRTADRSVVDVSVVVYSSRPILTSVSTLNEYLYQTSAPLNLQEVVFNPAGGNGDSITINVGPGNVVPPARPGDWFLDASYVPSLNQQYGTVNGYFYQVVNVTQNSETSYTFEVLQPLRNMPATMAVNPATNFPYAWQKLIFLEGVAEVFEKGPGRLP